MRTLTALHRAILTAALGLVVSLSLIGCSQWVVDAPSEDVGCSLLQFHGELVAENGRPVLKALGENTWGAWDGTTVPLRWPDGWTVRPMSDGQFEVLNRDGSVEVRTGTRVVLLAPDELGGTTYNGGEFSVCIADPLAL